VLPHPLYESVFSGNSMAGAPRSARSLVEYLSTLKQFKENRKTRKLTRPSSFRSIHLFLFQAPSNTSVPVADMKKSNECISVVGTGVRKLMVH